MNREEALAWTKTNYPIWVMGTKTPPGWKWSGGDEVWHSPYLLNKDGISIYKADWDTKKRRKKQVKNALDVQVGGGHYKDLAIQPVEYCMKNNLNYCQSNIVKYATRYKGKNGLEDLKKIKHYVDLIIELEYGDEESINNK